MAAPKVAFVGLGGMGRGLVKNMARKGVDVTAFDLRADAVEAAVAHGAHAGSEPVAMAADADIFAICITTAEAVQDLALKQGVLDAMRPGSIFLDHTTVSPSSTRSRGMSLRHVHISNAVTADKPKTSPSRCWTWRIRPRGLPPLPACAYR